jgi:hypothetical protein
MEYIHGVPQWVFIVDPQLMGVYKKLETSPYKRLCGVTVSNDIILMYGLLINN